jgi:hypothetical protein
MLQEEKGMKDLMVPRLVILWVLTLCSLVGSYQSVKGTCSLNL